MQKLYAMQNVRYYVYCARSNMSSALNILSDMTVNGKPLEKQNINNTITKLNTIVYLINRQINSFNS